MTTATQTQTKLTDSQIDKLALLLSYQYKGLTVLKGVCYNYNEDIYHVGNTVVIAENNSHSYTNVVKIGNKIFSNVVSNLKVWNRLDLRFNKFYTPLVISEEKLITYSNGQLVINKALELLNK